MPLDRRCWRWFWRNDTGSNASFRVERGCIDGWPEKLGFAVEEEEEPNRRGSKVEKGSAMGKKPPPGLRFGGGLGFGSSCSSRNPPEQRGQKGSEEAEEIEIVTVRLHW